MRIALLILLLMHGLGSGAIAQTAADDEAAAELTVVEARDISLDDFLWQARPIIIFADTPADPRFIEQMQLLRIRPSALIDRDVVVIVDTNPAETTEVRTTLRPRGFSLVFLQKDGRVAVRRPSPRDIREIERTIDNFALREEELRFGG